MLEKGVMLGLFSETSLHAGTGSSTGVVDLPIQRERHTCFPIIQASGLKGSMRELGERESKNSVISCDDIKMIFGPKESDHAGSLSIMDARLLAFPVRSLSHVYVWVTSKAVINRFKRDAALLDIASLKSLPNFEPGKGKALAVQGSGLGGSSNTLILEELSFDLDTSKNSEMTKLVSAVAEFLPNTPVHCAAREKMKKHLVVIDDEDFTYLVKNATQVSARIVLDGKTKTSENLWYEESMPPDSLFYTTLLAMKPRSKNSDDKDAAYVLSTFKKAIKDYIQIGGNETVGMGWCALQYYAEEGK